MHDPYSPQAIWGRELRHYRRAAGLTQAQLAALINYSESLISNIETGQVPAVPEFAAACDEALNTGGALLRQLDWRKAERFPAWFGEWPVIETKATVLRTFELAVVPGLLQTPAYAGALLDGDESAVEARMERQQILFREDPPPPKLRCVLDEAVLLRPVGSPEIMHEQLEHLLKMAESPRITLQVVPFGVHPGLQGSFWLASLGPGNSEVGYVETAVRGQIARNPEDLEILADLWDSIQAHALPQNASLDLIRRTVNERWT
ncbi:XRE family transcriptional regulator [Actinomadura craniellae]|uniref:XRE family transcriptional regulator n=1 Tax=Actinomadura craniellae TaxID=2231787 RepID=A0A365H3A9_9ACTN|nr:helix-turn-helix transcriptional regulator [Actinomadura craniellae]RAY13587.1 XRE family transcriptional regulator [Actinomadura craniellae]